MPRHSEFMLFLVFVVSLMFSDLNIFLGDDVFPTNPQNGKLLGLAYIKGSREESHQAFGACEHMLFRTAKWSRRCVYRGVVDLSGFICFGGGYCSP